MAIESGGVYYRLEGNTRNDILANVVKHLRLPEEVNRQHLTKALIAREELASTALGNGIAIPHPRNPGTPHINRSTITLFFLETPVNFAALDGQLTHILFVINATNVREHLHLLSKLAFVLRNEFFLSLLNCQASREQLYSGLKSSEASLVVRQNLVNEDSGV
jgi:PTS system nitrogen regulatory IIA component